MPTIEQLLREAMTAHTNDVPPLWAGAARTALRRTRRTRRLRLAALSMATVVATVTVLAILVSLQSHASLPTTTGTPPSQAPPDPVYSGFREIGEIPGDVPADLAAVTLPASVPSVPLTIGPTTYSQDNGVWVKYFDFVHPGSTLGSGVVIVTKGSVTPPRNPASPSPAAVPVRVAGHPAKDWVSGGDHWVFFSAGQFTVEVYASDKTVTTEQLVALADAMGGLPK